MTVRALTAIALLIAIGACSRTQANNSAPSAANNAASANAAATANAAAPAPAAQPAAPVNNAGSAAPEEGDIAAGQPPAPAPSPTEGCAGEIGLAAAQRLADQCRDVSPATRPPCNPNNSCALIRDEIRRGCGMLKTDIPAYCN